MQITSENIKNWLHCAAISPANTLKLTDNRAFGEPLIGYGNGADGLFEFFKRDIGEFYLLPTEWLAKKYKRHFKPENITVISWAFPQTDEARSGNRIAKKFPCRLWSLNRTYGESFNRETAAGLEAFLSSNGVPAIAPMAHPDFKWETSEKYGFASMWSERHTAYACGLGTFGLCDGLISPLGKAVRYGSVIAAIKFPVTERPYKTYNEWCLGAEKCGACIARCPAGAITKDGHDKQKCAEYQQKIVKPHCEGYGFEGIYGCGLCQTGVPCEHCVPEHKNETSGNGDI